MGALIAQLHSSELLEAQRAFWRRTPRRCSRARQLRRDEQCIVERIIAERRLQTRAEANCAVPASTSVSNCWRCKA